MTDDHGAGRAAPLRAGPAAVVDPRAVRHRVARPDAVASPTACDGLADRLRLPLVFKASFDKANRTSGKSFRGPGLDEGLEDARRRSSSAPGLPVTTDVHESPAGRRRRPRCATCCRSRRSWPGRPTCCWRPAADRPGGQRQEGPVHGPVGHGQRRREAGRGRQPNVLLTERGTTFGYGRLVNDMRAIPLMQDLGRPVIFDATHSVQKPGGLGDRTGGDRRWCRTWPGRRWPPAATACSSKRTRGPTRPRATART